MSLSRLLSFSVNRPWWRLEARHANKPPDSHNIFIVMWLLKEALLISDFLEKWIDFFVRWNYICFLVFHATVLISAALPEEHENVQTKTVITLKIYQSMSLYCHNKILLPSMGSKMAVSLTRNAMDCILTFWRFAIWTTVLTFNINGPKPDVSGSGDSNRWEMSWFWIHAFK